MLPLVLGGIAMAAVGYGVKELCESEGCPWDKEATPLQFSAEEDFAGLQKNKVSLHKVQLTKLGELLVRIAHVNEQSMLDDRISIKKEKLEASVLEEDVALYMGMYEGSIRKATRIANAYISELTTLLETSCNYQDYSKAERKSIKKACKLINQTQKLLVLPLLDEEDKLNVAIIHPLKAYKVFLEKYETHGSVSASASLHTLALMANNAFLK